MFTDPLIAQDFVEKTGVDCLACAFGTVHGLYATKPCLDYELVKNWMQPLVYQSLCMGEAVSVKQIMIS